MAENGSFAKLCMGGGDTKTLPLGSAGREGWGWGLLSLLVHDCEMGGALWWNEYVGDDSGIFYVRTNR